MPRPARLGQVGKEGRHQLRLQRDPAHIHMTSAGAAPNSEITGDDTHPGLLGSVSHHAPSVR